MADGFDEPDEVGTGLRLYPKDLMGHLLLVWSIEYIEHSPTAFTVPGKPSDVVVVDVVDLANEQGEPVRDPDNATQVGLLARRCWWRQAQLIKMLKLKIGNTSPLLVVMTKGGASMGRNAPFVLTSMTGDQRAVSMAHAWMQANGDFVPSRPLPKLEARTEEPQADPWAGQQPSLPPQRPPATPPAPATPRQSTILESMVNQSIQGGARAWADRQQQGEPPF
jgi:hypothetical protein